MNSGSQSSTRRGSAELGARDRRILDDMIRLRLLTNEAVQRRHMSEAKMNGAVKVTSRLVKSGWLNAYPFAGRRQYFVTGSMAVRAFGLPVSRTRPLGPQSLATHLSVVEYFTTVGPKLRSLSSTEIAERIVRSDNEQRSLVHAMEGEAANGPLQLIRVDLGGTPAHIAKKLNSDVSVRVGNSVYASLISQRLLIFVVLTPTESKKACIESAIRRRPWPTGLRFSVCVTPVLSSLLGEN